MLKQEYGLLIRNQMTLNDVSRVADGCKCNLAIVSMRKRLIDYDNLVAGCKQLIDALCDEGFIFDDAPKYLDRLNVTQTKADDNFVYISREILSQI